MKNQYLQGVLAASLLMACSGAFAATEKLRGKIGATLSDNWNYGKCMIKSTSFKPSINCPNDWFSLSCSGDYSSKEDARRMWDSAQMALALDLDVQVSVDDEKKHNKYCVIVRLDVIK